MKVRKNTIKETKSRTQGVRENTTQVESVDHDAVFCTCDKQQDTFNQCASLNFKKERNKCHQQQTSTSPKANT